MKLIFQVLRQADRGNLLSDTEDQLEAKVWSLMGPPVSTQSHYYYTRRRTSAQLAAAASP